MVPVTLLRMLLISSGVAMPSTVSPSKNTLSTLKLASAVTVAARLPSTTPQMNAPELLLLL